ncbi:DsbA family protein [Falsiroseomonas tokyonensis]|uniref:DsbA family protein n=2 Tax=Falsiroseomonas tokyonensis TaxID=430521 RepID=A0ABV7C2B3_9PROT|nr:thioredoxin domain-containing protein [Falsiroseomonas tokyonensis]
MNKRMLVLGTGAVALAGFAASMALLDPAEAVRGAPVGASVPSGTMVRPHSPVIGRAEAPVTMVEFLDPSCEACRAFHSVVKQILARYPDDVRVVVRYAPFHQGSDEAVRILEAARLQNLFEPVLEQLFMRQPQWAAHDAPNLPLAWPIAAEAGLDLARARRDAAAPAVDAVLRQDVADIQAIGVRQTPTFFVNGKPLPSFGARQLTELVEAEVTASRRARPGS